MPLMTTLIVATRNRHKVQEIRAVLGEGFQVLDLNSFPGAPAVVEDAPTFAGNALKKATELANWLREAGPQVSCDLCSAAVLADDSGLEVDALGGAPGVHSARFAALEGKSEAASSGNTPDTANNAKLLRLLDKVPREKRTARFRCVLALVPIDSGQSVAKPMLFEGKCEGLIGFAPRGKGGFGYDPLFLPLNHSESFAELGEEIKNRMSHRAQALEKLKEFYQQG